VNKIRKWQLDSNQALTKLLQSLETTYYQQWLLSVKWYAIQNSTDCTTWLSF